LEVNIQRDGQVTVVQLAGELCLASAALLERRLEEILQTDLQELIIDMRELSFLDSTAIRLLLTLDERAEVEGWSFAIVPGSGGPRRTLELVGLEHRPRRIAADDARLQSLA
jgi:anti-anti-sigma factor